MNEQNFTTRIATGLGKPRHLFLSLDFTEAFGMLGGAIAGLPIPEHDIDFLHGLLIGCAETIGNSLRDRIPELPPEPPATPVVPTPIPAEPAPPESGKLPEDGPPAPPKGPESPPAAPTPPVDKPPEGKPAESVISK